MAKGKRLMANVKCKIDKTMKKTYIEPEVQIVKVALHATFLQNVSINSSTEIENNGSNVGLTKEDRGWDIWGDDDNE